MGSRQVTVEKSAPLSRVNGFQNVLPDFVVNVVGGKL